MRKDASEEVKACDACQRFNYSKEGFHPLKPISAKLPFDHTAIDLVTPLPKGRDGCDTLLVVVDVFT